MRVITELKEKIAEYCYDDDYDAIFFSLKHNSEEFHLITCKKNIIENKITDIPISYLEKIKNNNSCCIKDYKDLYGSIIPKKVDTKLIFIKECEELNEALKVELRIDNLEEQIIDYYHYINESMEKLNNYYNKNNLVLNEKTKLFYNDCINNANKFISEKIRCKNNKEIIAKKHKKNFYENKSLLTTKNKQEIINNISFDNIDYYNQVESLAILYNFIDENKDIIIIPEWVYKIITKIIPNYFNEAYYDINSRVHEIANKLYKESDSSDLYNSYKEAYKAAIAVDR
jgi:hypothetical protein